MQRSAAKSVSSEPSTPNGPPAKKARLSNGTSAPGTPGTPSDHEIIQSAVAAEERKREEALAHAAENSGETKWVLSFKDPQNRARAPVMQVRQAGFATIDAEDDSDEDEEDRPVRMQFGGGLKKKQVVRRDTSGKEREMYTDQKQNPATPVKTEDADSESGSDSSGDFDSDDPTAELIRETRREVAAKERDSRKAKAAKETPKRYTAPINEDMDLGGLETLSGGSRRSNSNVECFNCKQKGHFRGQCPMPPTPRGVAGRGRSKSRGRR